MLNWILSILVNKNVITEQEADELSKGLVQKVHPSRFADAHEIVSKILNDLENDL